MQPAVAVRRRPAASSSSSSSGVQQPQLSAAGSSSSPQRQQQGADSAATSRQRTARQQQLRRAAAALALLLGLAAAAVSRVGPGGFLRQQADDDGYFDQDGLDGAGRLHGGAAWLGAWQRQRRAQQQQQDAQPQPPPQLPQHEAVVDAGGRVLYGPSMGAFPRGCKWREVMPPPGAGCAAAPPDPSSTSSPHLPPPAAYEYWDEAGGGWVAAQPAACRLRGFAPPAGPPRPWRLHKGNPRTEVVPHAHHVLYRNLWYNNGRWYALVDSGRAVGAWKWSRNHEVSPLAVRDARAWLNATRWRVVPGDTLLFDFIFFVHPTAIGHWWELLAPLYSVIRGLKQDQQQQQQQQQGGSDGGGSSSDGGGDSDGGGFRWPADQVVLLHLRRAHLMEWVRAVMGVALGVGGTAAPLPPILLQQETDHAWQQLTMPLEGVSPDEWVMFDRVIIPRDVFTGGNRSFATTRDARRFRAAVYRQYGLPPPSPRRSAAVPRVITFQRKRANRAVLNEAALLELLGRYGEVRAVEFNATTSFAAQLAAMAGTGVFVSAHTSNLANAVFLQPGSAVVELIHRHWTWNDIDQSFRAHTRALGDIHHYAWRANAASQSRYQLPRDAARFTNWTTAECLTSDCTEAATRVDVWVDLDQLAALLDSRLPLVFRGAAVADAALPWPDAL